MIKIEVKGFGTIMVELDKEAAPKTVENFEKLVSEGFYDGLIFHRVIKDFMEAHPKMKLKMGVVEGEFYNEAQIVEFANIPPREVLLAKLLGSLKAPMSNFVYLVDALVKEKEGQEA